MDFAHIEADRLRSALRETPFGDRFDQLYVAQQALAWMSDPDRFESPLHMVDRFTLGIEVDSKDCLSECDPAAFG
jgi:hypothetical protein